MNSFKRKLLWITLFILFAAGVTFLCFCFIPLEQQKEDNAMLMLQENGKHDDHVYRGEDDLICPGCHPWMWRFNVRFREGEEFVEEVKEKQRKEQIRQEKLDKKRKK